MANTDLQKWFLPAAVCVTLACVIYLFEEVQEEVGARWVGEYGLLGSGLLLTLVTLRRLMEELGGERDYLLATALAFESLAVVGVVYKIYQD